MYSVIKLSSMGATICYSNLDYFLWKARDKWLEYLIFPPVLKDLNKISATVEMFPKLVKLEQ